MICILVELVNIGGVSELEFKGGVEIEISLFWLDDVASDDGSTLLRFLSFSLVFFRICFWFGGTDRQAGRKAYIRIT